MAKRKNKKTHLPAVWQRFAYKHTVSAIVAITIFVLLLDTVIVQTLLQSIVGLGYIGILLSGILFVSFFTAAPAVALLLTFVSSYDPLLVALIAGFGAMLGDLILLRFIGDRVGHELKPIAKRMKLLDFINLLHKKRLKPITATIGAIIIASPLPDEAGIALIGLSHISTIQLMILAFLLNTGGIFALLIMFG